MLAQSVTQPNEFPGVGQILDNSRFLQLLVAAVYFLNSLQLKLFVRQFLNLCVFKAILAILACEE